MWEITLGRNSPNSNVTMSQEQFGQLISAVTAQHQFHDVYFGMNSNDYKRFKVLQQKGKNRSEQEKKEFKALKNKHKNMTAKNKKGGGKKGKKRQDGAKLFKDTCNQMLSAYQDIQNGKGAPENTNMEEIYNNIKSSINSFKPFVPIDDTFALDKLLLRSLGKRRGLPESVKKLVRTYTTENPDEQYSEYEAHMDEFAFLILVLLNVSHITTQRKVPDQKVDPDGSKGTMKTITSKTYKYKFIQKSYNTAMSLLQVALNTDDFTLSTKKYERNNPVQNSDMDTFTHMASNTYKNLKSGNVHKTYYFKNNDSLYSKRIVWPGVFRKKGNNGEKDQIIHFVFFIPARQNPKWEEHWKTIKNEMDRLSFESIKDTMISTQMYLEGYLKTTTIEWSWKFGGDANPTWSDIPGDKMEDFQWKHLPKKQMRGRNGISIEESTSLDTLLEVIAVQKEQLTLQSVFNFALPREFFETEDLSVQSTRTDSVTRPVSSVRKSLLSWD